MRGQARDYDGWARRSAASPAGAGTECLPFFLQHEDHWRGADEFHGAGVGPRRSTRRRRMARRAAAPVTGRSSTPSRPRPAGRHPGAPTTSTAATTKASATSKSTSAAACAGTRRRRSCVRPVSSARTSSCGPARTSRRLVVERGGDGRLRCTGAEVATPHGVETVRAGARGDPCGRRDRLAADCCSCRASARRRCWPRHGIAPLHELPGVGENLQDHLQIRAVFKVSGVPTLNTLAGALARQAAHRGCSTRSCAAGR